MCRPPRTKWIKGVDLYTYVRPHKNNETSFYEAFLKSFINCRGSTLTSPLLSVVLLHSLIFLIARVPLQPPLFFCALGPMFWFSTKPQLVTCCYFYPAYKLACYHYFSASRGGRPLSQTGCSSTGSGLLSWSIPGTGPKQSQMFKILQKAWLCLSSLLSRMKKKDGNLWALFVF